MKLPGQGASTVPEESEAAASKSQAKPESLEEMKSAVHQVSKLGFSVGAHVVNKKTENVQVFEVIAITSEAAMLLERGLIMTKAPTSLSVNLKKLTEEWKPFKGKITCPLKGWSSEIGSPFGSQEFCWEVIKGKIMNAMMKLYGDNMKVLQHLKLMQNPNMVICTKEMKPRELCLVVAATYVMQKTCPQAIKLGTFSLPGTSHVFHAFMPKDPATIKQEALVWAIPFWMVQSDEDTPNMHMEFKEVHIDGMSIHIPMLLNKKKIEANTILTTNRKAIVKLAAASSPKKQRVG